MSFTWVNSPEPPRPTRATSPVVWHYTGAEGLLGILQSNRFWASDPIALNDRRELKYGFDVIDREWNTMRNTVASEPELVEFVDDLLSESWQTSLLESVFIVSASESCEIASQWLNYAQTTGFAIGLERKRLWWPIPSGSQSFRGTEVTKAPEIAPLWVSVDYDAAEQSRTARDLLGSAIEAARTDPTSWTRDLLRMQFAIGVASFKHYAFAAEQEVRLAVPRVGQAVNFRAASGRLIPYTEVACFLPEPESNSGNVCPLPITEVVCAANASATTIETVRRLLTETGYGNVEVKKSSLPLG